MRRWRVALDAGMDPRWDVVRLPGQVMRQETIWKLRREMDRAKGQAKGKRICLLPGPYFGVTK